MDKKGRLTKEEEEVVRKVGRMYDDACAASQIVFEAIIGGNSQIVTPDGQIHQSFLDVEQRRRKERELGRAEHDLVHLRNHLLPPDKRGTIPDARSGCKIFLSYEAVAAQDRRYQGGFVD